MGSIRALVPYIEIYHRVMREWSARIRRLFQKKNLILFSARQSNSSLHSFDLLKQNGHFLYIYHRIMYLRTFLVWLLGCQYVAAFTSFRLGHGQRRTATSTHPLSMSEYGKGRRKGKRDIPLNSIRQLGGSLCIRDKGSRGLRKLASLHAKYNEDDEEVSPDGAAPFDEFKVKVETAVTVCKERVDVFVQKLLPSQFVEFVQILLDRLTGFRLLFLGFSAGAVFALVAIYINRKLNSR
jgi:hypothetical protein